MRIGLKRIQDRWHARIVIKKGIMHLSVHSLKSQKTSLSLDNLYVGNYG